MTRNSSNKIIPMNPYFERSILDVDPLELTRLVYQRALDSVTDARRYLREGKIEERVQSISRAYAAIDELQASLRPEAAPELARRMGILYDYIQTSLIHANFSQQDEPLAVTHSLLNTLAEGWKGVTVEMSRPPDVGRQRDPGLAMTA